ncbi:type II toxin-antitoxin system YafQ family toxin [Bifidobacterium dentium]|uniref:type II toxin-antitoxin system YafQ family toxin n=1 Tax=Bifidobacterium dentium TaxID=1689 RepID=UPI000944ECC2
MAGICEFHVRADRLVVYFRDNDTVALVLMRTGSHDALFKIVDAKTSGTTGARLARQYRPTLPSKPFNRVDPLS